VPVDVGTGWVVCGEVDMLLREPATPIDTAVSGLDELRDKEGLGKRQEKHVLKDIIMLHKIVFTIKMYN